jgi:hypothetical protein
MSRGAGHRVYPATDGSKMQASQIETCGQSERPKRRPAHFPSGAESDLGRG